MILRPPSPNELPALSALCLRSKAHWGYDAAFMEACREELTLTPEDLETTGIAVAERDGAAIGLVQVAVEDGICDLLKLFVDPDAMGMGCGQALFDWAVAEGKRRGASRMTIEADPDAEPFYQRMGAVTVGTAASGSIPGRVLPLLELRLSSA